ncbi:reprolysin-like metallopeptidase [Tenacibaculum sp. MEBiC06402]|uniref:zinc-dependent metalloprotease n=1 Tax=unclassified Tenacibaculum TaxID=2635139 RepID=UPI003B99C8BD
MKKITLVLALSCVVFVNAQSLWKKIDLQNTSFRSEKTFRKSQPTEFSIFSLNLESFKNQLTSQSKGFKKIIELPGHDGKIKEFVFKENSNFTEPLNPKYGFIKTYTIHGVKDKNESGKVSIGTDGVHIVLNSPERGTFYVDPYTKDNKNYIAYNRNSFESNDTDFVCFVKENVSRQETKLSQQKNANDGNLRTYRLALACTGEYSTYHIENQGISGGTITEKEAAVLSAMNTTLTRINQIFEKELAVKLNMVISGGRNRMLFLNANTDGYSGGDDIDLMINENITRTNGLLGPTNYDIGHLFHKSSSVSGLAYVSAVCQSFKAGGVTSSANPIGDQFDIHISSHELGHQFGANHTQNNGCNRNNETGIEPGSGSTIMSYAGICPPNVQSIADDYFHAVSINEMWTNIQGTFCGVTTATGNTAPIADAGPDYNVPTNTPLILNGKGEDVDVTDNLSYNWEQIDNGIGFMPPTSNGKGPLFRSIPPSASSQRFLPDLENVLSGSNSNLWEVLPSEERDVNFAFTVRDNHPGGGSSARDDMKITFVNSIGFRLTSFENAINVDGGTLQNITWDVATTDQTPISCQNVRIKLSTDGGLTFPIVLEDSTPNDGIHEVLIPNIPTAQARIKIEGISNIFYNINNSNFRIVNNPTASVENFEFSNFNLYPNPSNGNFKITFEVINTESVKIKLFDLRGRLVGIKEFSNTSNTFSQELSFNYVNAGLYLLEVSNGNKKTVKKIIKK